MRWSVATSTSCWASMTDHTVTSGATPTARMVNTRFHCSNPRIATILDAKTHALAGDVTEQGTGRCHCRWVMSLTDLILATGSTRPGSSSLRSAACFSL